MNNKLFIDNQNTRAIYKIVPKTHTKPFYTPFGTSTLIHSNKVLKPRKPSQIGSESYRTSLSRAFNRVKQQIYFNPDMTQLITLTYAENMQDLERLKKDVKQLIKIERDNKKQNIKYAWTVEKQKRGALHVHMISTPFFETHKNKNNYKTVTNWKHGYSSILDIKNADENFKPYLYLFKYMLKSQRIGKTFIHTSNNLNNFEQYQADLFQKNKYKVIQKEETYIPPIDRTIKTTYYKKTN